MRKHLSVFYSTVLLLAGLLLALSLLPTGSAAAVVPSARLQQVDGSAIIELGENDFRISRVSDPAVGTFDATDPTVVFNSSDQEYLVLWEADVSSDGLVEGEFEIFGQRIDAISGELLGERIRVSAMGPDGNPDFDAFDVAAAYNSQFNEYLVVFQGDDNRNGLVDNEFEIFGQRLAADGTLIDDRMRLSDMGPDGDTNFRASRPQVAYNSQDNQYLVVWEGDDNTGNLVEDEFEIFGQRLLFDRNNVLQERSLEFFISSAGGFGNAAIDAGRPEVVYNPNSHTFLIIWQQVNDSSPIVVEERFSIFAELIDASTSVRLGIDDFEIFRGSTIGQLSISLNSRDNQYLIAWNATNRDLFIQILAADGNPIAGPRMIYQGQSSASRFTRIFDIAYNARDNEYLVLLEDQIATANAASEETEILAGRLNPDGNLITPLAIRLSDAGADGDPRFATADPMLIYNERLQQYLAIWEADDDRDGLLPGETEIFGQRLAGAPAVAAFSQETYQAAEPEVSSEQIAVVRQGNLDTTAVLRVEITGGDATAGSDFSAAGFPLTLSFLPGESRMPVPLTILDDKISEAGETISFTLNPISGIALDEPLQATLTISDDDQAPPDEPPDAPPDAPEDPPEELEDQFTALLPLIVR